MALLHFQAKPLDQFFSTPGKLPQNSCSLFFLLGHGHFFATDDVHPKNAEGAAPKVTPSRLALLVYQPPTISCQNWLTSPWNDNNNELNGGKIRPPRWTLKMTVDPCRQRFVQSLGDRTHSSASDPGPRRWAGDHTKLPRSSQIHV